MDLVGLTGSAGLAGALDGFGQFQDRPGVGRLGQFWVIKGVDVVIQGFTCGSLDLMVGFGILSIETQDLLADGLDLMILMACFEKEMMQIYGLMQKDKGKKLRR